MTIKNTVIGLLVLAIIGGGFLFAQKKGYFTKTENNESQIKSLTVEKPNFIVTGSNLTAVEIMYGFSTDGQGHGRDPELIGKAVLQSDNKGEQVWTLAIPEEPFLANEIFAKGFDRKEQAVAKVSLETVGATSIYNVLWGSGTDKIDEVVTLKVGEPKNVAGLVITILKISEDSRCPIDVQCIQAGRVAVQFEVSAGTNKEDLTMYSDEDRVLDFEGYKIDFVKVTPTSKVSGVQIKPADYTFTFKISHD